MINNLELSLNFTKSDIGLKEADINASWIGGEYILLRKPGKVVEYKRINADHKTIIGIRKEIETKVQELFSLIGE